MSLVAYGFTLNAIGGSFSGVSVEVKAANVAAVQSGGVTVTGDVPGIAVGVANPSGTIEVNMGVDITVQPTSVEVEVE